VPVCIYVQDGCDISKAIAVLGHLAKVTDGRTVGQTDLSYAESSICIPVYVNKLFSHPIPLRNWLKCIPSLHSQIEGIIPMTTEKGLIFLKVPFLKWISF
jgi:hypothetical protein